MSQSLKMPPFIFTLRGGYLTRGRWVPHRGHFHTNVEGVSRCQGSAGVKAVKRADTCLSVFPHDLRYQFILTWQGRHHDHEGGSPSARLSHCTPCFADPSEFPKCGNLDCIISGSGGLRSRSPLIKCRNQSSNQTDPSADLFCTCLGLDRLGIPGAVRDRLRIPGVVISCSPPFFSLLHFGRLNGQPSFVVHYMTNESFFFLERRMLAVAISASCSEKGILVFPFFCHFQHSRGRCTVPGGTAMPGRCVE